MKKILEISKKFKINILFNYIYLKNIYKLNLFFNLSKVYNIEE